MKKLFIILILIVTTLLFCQHVFADSTVLKIIITRIQAKLTPLNPEPTCNKDCTPAKLITVEGQLLPPDRKLELIKDESGIGEIIVKQEK